ncbi:hypothetical protein Aperf_G00000023973 [Anoplocephala perfoliata]
MNGFGIAHTTLRVGRAITPKSATSNSSSAPSASATAAVAAAAASISARVSALEHESATQSAGDVSTSSSAAAATGPVVTSSSSGFSTGWGPGEPVPPPGVFVPPVVLGVGPTPPPSGVPAPEDNSGTAVARWDEDDVTMTTQPPANQNGAPIEDAYSPSALSPVQLDDDLSRVVLLENMVTPEEVDPDLEEEVAEECNKFGQILRVLIHVKTSGQEQQEDPESQPSSSTDVIQPSATSGVRIFVHFDSHAAAVDAIQALNGRFFAGREIVARLYPDEEFQMRNLDI